VKANQADHPRATMCRVLGVSPNGYYAWRQRPPSARARQDAELTMKIHTIHLESRGTYGAPRVHAELAAQGLRVGRKRVARLMRTAAVQGVSRRKRIVTTTGSLAKARHDVQRHLYHSVRRFLRRRHKVAGPGYRQFPEAAVFGELSVLALNRFPQLASRACRP